jgi:pilus assembly protein Flp/PilA
LNCYNQFNLIPVERRWLNVLYAPSDRGQGLAEYAFILVLIAIVVIVILSLFGEAVGGMYSDIISQI